MANVHVLCSICSRKPAAPCTPMGLLYMLQESSCLCLTCCIPCILVDHRSTCSCWAVVPCALLHGLRQMGYYTSSVPCAAGAARLLHMLWEVTGTFVPAYFCSRERKFHRWNFRSLELSFPGTFAPWNFRSRCPKFVFLAATRALLRPIGLWKGSQDVITCTRRVKAFRPIRLLLPLPPPLRPS